MFISRKRGLSVAPPNLTIDGTPLITVTEYKYLGVTITSDMSWSPHITNICNKTRKLIGLLYRRFYQNSNSQTLLTLYKSFIRPHLEYSSAVWNPHLKGEIEALEKVQKFALRVCTKSWDSDYNALLSRTSLPSLQTRRVQASLCHLYKIIHNLTDFPEAPVSNRVIPYHSRYNLSIYFPSRHLHTKTLFFHPRSVIGISYQRRYWNVILCGHLKGNY